MIDWQPIETAPTGARILIWVTGKMLAGVRFGSAYRGAGGKIVAKPEGGNGDWTNEITHWAPIPDGPNPVSCEHRSWADCRQAVQTRENGYPVMRCRLTGRHPDDCKRGQTP